MRVLYSADGKAITEDNPLPVQMAGGGSAGKSAYEIAVDNGFEGSETDWLESLKGDPGDPGAPGEPGKDAEPQFTEDQKSALLALLDE